MYDLVTKNHTGYVYVRRIRRLAIRVCFRRWRKIL